MNTGDMEKYCPKPHPVYFNAFSMWQQLSGSVQYLIRSFNCSFLEIPVLKLVRLPLVYLVNQAAPAYKLGIQILHMKCSTQWNE